METLYVIEQGAYLKKDGNALKIMKQQTKAWTMPPAAMPAA